MAKIESIRPGGALEGTFADYPLADLLIGLLRGNLSGRLDVALSAEPKNAIHFKDGVPVSVHVPDLGVSLARILAERGNLSRDRALEVLRQAEETGKTESRLILEEQLLSSGAVMEARRRRAREQLVRLFDASTVGFKFTEGAPFPQDAALAILQPLPIVFEGLLKSRDRKVITRFLNEHGTAHFRLAPTYPRAVDPFEWGGKVESAILGLESLRTIADLEQPGLSRETVTVALATLHLTGMIEVHRTAQAVVPARPAVFEPAILPSPGRTEPRAPGRSEVASPGIPFDDSDASGLVVLRRSTAALERAKPEIRLPDVQASSREPVPPRESAPEAADYEALLDQISDRLDAVRGRTYFKVLRITDSASIDQIERSYRHLVRQLDEGPVDAACPALKDVLSEAYKVLGSETDGRRYRELVERAKTSPQAVVERQAWEAEPKVDRALLAMGDGRLAEAAYLIDWAQALDGSRRDLKIFRGVLRYLRAPRQHRASEAWSLKPALLAEIQRSPNDARLRVCLALVTEANDEPDEA